MGRRKAGRNLNSNHSINRTIMKNKILITALSFALAASIGGNVYQYSAEPAADSIPVNYEKEYLMQASPSDYYIWEVLARLDVTVKTGGPGVPSGETTIPVLDPKGVVRIVSSKDEITGADISWDIPLGDFPGVVRTKKGIAYSRKLPRGMQPAPNSDDTE